MTNISEIVDLFMMLQTDYRLKKIFSIGEAELNLYLEPWALMAMVILNNVKTESLVYDTATQNFSTTLSVEDKVLLAQLMLRYWLEKEVNDVLAFTNVLHDHDFKQFSQAQNLDARRALLSLKIEETDKLLKQYSYSHNNWTAWADQSFGG